MIMEQWSFHILLSIIIVAYYLTQISEIFHLYCDGYTEAYLKADFVNTQVTKTQIFN